MSARIPVACLLALLLGLACGQPEKEERRPPRATARGEFTVTATAYNSRPDQTDSHPRLTASGVRLEPGMRAIAVSPDLGRRGLEFGTRVHIEGIQGTWQVLDRMPSGRKRIDLYFGDDEEAAREFGKRRVRISWEAP